MDVDELMERAWKAVEKAGVPEASQPTALKEAVAFLREAEGGGAGKSRSGGSKAKRQGASSRKHRSTATSEAPADDLPDEDTFFAQLANESGVEEGHLRDILLYKGGNVTVTPPTRKLGESVTEQAKCVTALVAGARSKGLGESPVNAEAVRDELKRKGCWDMNNFAGRHLGPLRGFNSGSKRTEITLTSKWVGEFSDAAATALGTNGGDGD